MSLQHKRYWAGATVADIIPNRPPATRAGTVVVTNETALRHSAVWAALRLRANLISTMPVDCYRKVLGVQVEVPKPPVLVTPGGDRVEIEEFLYSSQFDLDRAGNDFGIIAERSGLGLPARIDLVPLAEVAVQVRKGKLDHYRIAGTKYQPEEVWHEKQYTVPGLHVGLSPVAYAAWSIGEYLSITEFALDWFGNGQHPSAMLKNETQTLSPEASDVVRERFRAAIKSGDVFVTGKDWSYEMLQAEQAGSSWLEAKGASNTDIARFFDVPADLIDAAVKGDSVTYANIVERNIQLLVMHLGPAVVRRERALSRLLARPRFVKLNTDALLRMDHKTRHEMFKTQIESRTLAPSEARALENRPPLNEAQLTEIERLFGAPSMLPPILIQQLATLVKEGVISEAWAAEQIGAPTAGLSTTPTAATGPLSVPSLNGAGG